mgnify:CR=1 FL=1
MSSTELERASEGGLGRAVDGASVRRPILKATATDTSHTSWAADVGRVNAVIVEISGLAAA